MVLSTLIPLHPVLYRIEALGLPLRDQTISLPATIDQHPLVVVVLSDHPPARAVEGDEEPGHDRVVTSRLGMLEQSLDQRLVAKCVEGPFQVVQQQPARVRRGVGVPPLGEVAEGVGVVGLSQPVDELGIAPFEHFVQ